MPAARVNHISLVTTDLAESVRFYNELLGMSTLPTPNFGFPVQWLAVGGLQLHLFQRPEDAPRHHHTAFTVANAEFPALYREARRRGITDGERFGHHLYHLPGDAAQLYILDPSGNLLEIDCEGASRLPDDIRADMRPLLHAQGPANAGARLFLEQP